MAKPKHNNKPQPPSAERILRWLEEANQFAKLFLSQQELLKWEKVKNRPPNKPVA